ncbi:hypothetical protein MKY96_33140 [Paenibacillus sp. FSL R7-0302]|uniref:hypothetical protein n=1 Tax=Paenibacillus sp. FSL R7-0302 TaxID=2921681 RepID=UPI0030F68B35
MLDKYGVKEVADVTMFDLSSNLPFLFLDTLKMTVIENQAETSYARGGKGNPKLLGWDFNREATVQMQDALMSMKSISLLTGNKVVTGVANVHSREVLTAVVGATGKTKVTPSKTPLAGTVSAFLVSDDSNPVEATVATGDITFDVADVAVGAQVAVYYLFATTADAQTIRISADKFPAYIKVVGDTVIRNARTGEDEAFQFIIHKAKIAPNFTLTFQADGEPTAFDMNLDVFRRDTDSEMISMIKY